MYLPDAFRLDDRATLLAQAEAYPFATVITQGEGGLAVSHLPLLVGAGSDLLRGHLARENPQLAHLAAGAEALAIFHGPHGYVSPSVYTEQPSVPTWNYLVVHARGRSRLVGEPALREILDQSAARRKQVEAFAKIDAILSTGNQPPSVRAADIVLAEMRKPRRAN